MATKVNVISYRKRKGMYMEGTVLKGQLVNTFNAVSVDPNVDTSMVTNGSYMFIYRLNLTSWSANLPNLTISDHMFSECSDLTSFSAALPNLTQAYCMFYKCENLASWTSELPNLLNGERMFGNCESLTSWTVDLPNMWDRAPDVQWLL